MSSQTSTAGDSLIGYYLGAAIRGLRRDAGLSALIIIVVAVGIAALMSVVSVVRTMSADPIAGKSSRLFAVTLDNWGPDNATDPVTHDQLTYVDAMALMHARAAERQTPMYAVFFTATPTSVAAGPTVRPFLATGRAVDEDFFGMFNAPFRMGRPWSRTEDAGGARVVVLGANMAARLFPHGGALGGTVELGTVALSQQAYRVVGVLAPWRLRPRVYDLTPRIYQQTEDVFLPLATAINQQMQTEGTIGCERPPLGGWSGLLASECRWLQFWVQLDTPAAVAAYHDVLVAYAAEQRRSGRFGWPPQVGLYDAGAWLAHENMVPEGLRVSELVALGFWLVCLLNAVGLLLTKFRARSGELGVRRALGAARRHIFAQCLAEAALVGAAGGALGLLLTYLGLAVERTVLREDYAQFAHLSPRLIVLLVALALAATCACGLYPAWRAGRVAPGSALRSA